MRKIIRRDIAPRRRAGSFTLFGLVSKHMVSFYPGFLYYRGPLV